MTYAQNGVIDNADYNTLAWGTAAGGTYTTATPNLAAVWGVGTAEHGMGGSVASIAAVANSATVTATQWTGLIQTLNNTLAHHGQATISPSSVTAGNLITYYSTIASGITNAYNAAGSVSAVTDSSAYATSYAAAWGNTTERRLRFTHTVTFASGDHARYFFNAGGKIKLNWSHIGGTANTRNADWKSLCAYCGTVSIGYKNTTKGGGYGTPNVILNSNNGGYWANNNVSPVLHFRQYSDSAPYTLDHIAVQAYWAGTPSNGGYPQLIIVADWENDYTNVYQETVDGTCTSNVYIGSPPTTYLGSATWGTPSVGGTAVVQ